MAEPLLRKPAAAAAPLPSGPDPLLGRFLADARTWGSDQLLPMRADPHAVEQVVASGLGAVLTWAEHVAEHLPHVDLAELRALPDLARCLVHATEGSLGGAEALAEIAGLVAEAQDLRRLLLSSARALVQAGSLAARDLAKVGPEAERGAVDVGADCAALAALFEKRAEELAGAHPLGEEQIARAAEVGAALRAAWKPRAAARKPDATGLSPVEARDRLWTLLVARHERLWAVGSYVYGHAVDDQVPPLCGPVPTKKASKAKG